MAFITPRTWVALETVTASIMNIHVRDNLNALKDPPTALYILNEAVDYTTTSTSFVNVDATDLALTITTTGGDVMIGFHGQVVNSGLNKIYFDVNESVGAARLGGDDGMTMFYMVAASQNAECSFTWLARSLSAAAHTFTLQWKTSAGTATLYAGAGTSTFDLHGIFWVREVS